MGWLGMLYLPFFMHFKISLSFSPKNGKRSKKSLKNMTPIAHMSDFVEQPFLFAVSIATQGRVPHQLAFLHLGSLVDMARPKSHIFISMRLVVKTFSSFKSRWIIPFAWMNLIPSTSCRPICAHCFMLKHGVILLANCRNEELHNSITM